LKKKRINRQFYAMFVGDVMHHADTNS